MKSLRRGLDILTLFSERPRQDFAELRVATKLPRSSQYRFLRTLEEGGVVRQDPLSRAWAPGRLLYRLGSAGGGLRERRTLARVATRTLACQIGRSVYVHARDGTNRGRVEVFEAGASGKAIPAFLPTDERARLVGARLPRLIGPAPGPSPCRSWTRGAPASDRSGWPGRCPGSAETGRASTPHGSGQHRGSSRRSCSGRSTRP